MTSQRNGETEDKDLLERYRRASGNEASAPSDAVRAAILAEGRRVAERLTQESHAKRESKTPLDTSRPAANDARWKITAFGTMGAALLAALLIAPRYWDTSRVKKESAAQTAAPVSEPAAAPNLESVAPAASSEALQDAVVTGARRQRADAQAEVSAKSASAKPAAAPPKDVSLSDAPPPAPAAATNSFAERAPSGLPGEASGGAERKSADSQSVAQTLARPEAADRLFKNAQMPATLQTAVKSGDLVLAAKLLDQGTVVNARDSHGRTPLMLAISEGRLEVVRLLLQRGADPNAADDSGKTPLQQATDQNLKDIAELLRGAGAR
jgi:hypothetical protein